VSWREAGRVLASRAGAPPRVGVVLGSGLGMVAEAVREPIRVPYEELPGFPRPTVAGHGGNVVLGVIGGVPLALLQGRAHVYEGGDLDEVRTPVRALKAAGAEILVLTNAAGSLRPEVAPGQLMLITDHINLSGTNVLAGPNDDELGIGLAEGVYLAVQGPSFETPAEIRAFRTLGADAVGMSTVHETILARHCGLRVAALSAITNLAEGMSESPLSHDQTLRDAARAAENLAPLLVRFLERLSA
jgi:xanthosine phosphorylase